MAHARRAPGALQGVDARHPKLNTIAAMGTPPEPPNVPMGPDGNMAEPLSPTLAVDLVRYIYNCGEVAYFDHLHQQLQKRDMTVVDVDNVLRAGRVLPDFPPEQEHGFWRYRIQTQQMAVIVQFESPTVLWVVTAWRKTR